MRFIARRCVAPETIVQTASSLRAQAEFSPWWTELSRPAQELSELIGFDAIGLVAEFEEMVLTGIADDELGDERFNQIVEPGGLSVFFESEVDGARETSDEIADLLGRGLSGRLTQELAGRVVKCDGSSCVMDIETTSRVTE
jgi:hypothetical protein